MTSINISLKNTIMSYIRKREPEQENIVYNINGINPSKQQDVIDEILSCLDNKYYFVYKEGSTKFNDKLFIVSKDEIKSYLFEYGYMIFDPTSLSFMQTGHTDVYIGDGNTIESVVDNQLYIDTDGVFDRLLLHIASKFEYIESASKLPVK